MDDRAPVGWNYRVRIVVDLLVGPYDPEVHVVGAVVDEVDGVSGGC